MLTGRLSDGSRESETQRDKQREINDPLHLQESSSSSFVFIDRLLTQTCLIGPRDCSSHCDGWDALKRLPLFFLPWSHTFDLTLLYLYVESLM